MGNNLAQPATNNDVPVKSYKPQAMIFSWSLYMYTYVYLHISSSYVLIYT